MSKKLSGRITLITGAARGIGAAVAERFAFEGAHLILVSKSQSGLEALDDKIKSIGGNATLVPLDLVNGSNIDDMAAAISKRFGKIDILIGNAAILGQLSPMSHYTPEMWEEVFKVNLHANWRLIRDFEQLLRESDAGRALFVTSGIANIPRAYWGPYSSSKAALEKMIKDWAMELQNTSVKVNIIDPGPINTHMRKQAYPGEDPKKNLDPKEITDLFLELTSSSCTKNGELIKAQI